MASEILEIKVKLINDKVQFEGTAKTNPPVIIDYNQPIGDGYGYTSLELLLISLSSCVGTSVLSLLRRTGKDIKSFSITAKGERREQHPLSFQKIILNINICSPDALETDVQKVLKLSEDSFCPVWAMLKGNVEIEKEISITK